MNCLHSISEYLYSSLLEVVVYVVNIDQPINKRGANDTNIDSDCNIDSCNSNHVTANNDKNIDSSNDNNTIIKTTTNNATAHTIEPLSTTRNSTKSNTSNASTASTVESLSTSLTTSTSPTRRRTIESLLNNNKIRRPRHHPSNTPDCIESAIETLIHGRVATTRSTTSSFSSTSSIDNNTGINGDYFYSDIDNEPIANINNTSINTNSDISRRT